MFDPNAVKNLEPFLAIIHDVSNKISVNEILLESFILTETRGETWAIRYEPKFPFTYMPMNYKAKLGISFDTEVTCQHTSWGLLQIMGCVAREQGFDDHLTKLVTPELGIYWGARKIHSIQKNYSNQDDVISAYNGGSPKKDSQGRYFNQSYVDEVNAYLKFLEAKKSDIT